MGQGANQTEVVEQVVAEYLPERKEGEGMGMFYTNYISAEWVTLKHLRLSKMN